LNHFLQETNLLAKKMEKLTLEDDEVLVGSNNFDGDSDKQVKEHLREGTEETEEMPGGLTSPEMSGMPSHLFVPPPPFFL